jgi:uncharacterized protein (UPF0332 family)
VTGRSGMDRCREELAAARLLADKGFEAQAVSRAYFAAFLAAETALLALGETRSKHSGVISAFVHLVIRRGQSMRRRDGFCDHSSNAGTRPTTHPSTSPWRRPMRPYETRPGWLAPWRTG